MAPRVKATVSSDDFDVDGSYPESSPDPLAGSVNGNKARPQGKSTRASKAPLASSSPSKQNRRPSISEQTLDFSSPSKSIIMNTGRPGGASPWRIKVTVEAEPDTEDSENIESPTVKRLTRTRTTTVPLKDHDAASPVKRRGRPRKSDTSTSARPKRSGTPVRKRSKATGRTSSGAAAADASAADVDTDSAPKKRRGRPRKSIQPVTEDDDTLVVNDDQFQETFVVEATSGTSEEPELEAEVPDMQSTAATPAPAPVPQMTVPVIETTFATPQESQPKPILNPPLNSTALLPPKEQSRKQRPREYEEPMVFTPPETDLSRRIRARKGTPAAKGKIVLEDSSDEDGDINTPSGTDEEAPPTETNVSDPLLQAVIRSEEVEPMTAQAIEDYDDDDDDELQDITNFAFDEGATRMPDDTTILESENFSMVSVDSLPSSNGLSSPPNENVDRSPAAENLESVLDQSYLQIPSATSRKTRSSPQQAIKASPSTSYTATSTSHFRSSPRVPPRRQHTPAIDSRSPSNPPAIEPAHFSPSTTETPKIGRVVKAGVALQGVLDPNRVTPDAQSSKQALDKQRDHLDDLFRGFSEGTRRELQAGLRLGEQLAQQKLASRQSSPALSSPIKAIVPTGPADDVFYPRTKHRTSRLPTPEDQGDYTLPVPPPPPAEDTEVKYPSLKVREEECHLISPARSVSDKSEEEMSWRVDTPPVRAFATEGGPLMTAVNEQGQEIRGAAIFPIRGITTEGQHFMTAVNEQGEELHGAEIFVVADEDEQEDHYDIWQEEASRSSELPVDKGSAPQSTSGKTPQLQDLFANDGPFKPARGKLPRTWRRKSSSDFHYSDEAEEHPQKSPSSSSTSYTSSSSSRESDEPAPPKLDKGKGKAMESPIIEEQYLEDENEDGFSEASDDTGMFFQSNLPNIFNKKRSVELRRKKAAEKLDLSLLMGEGESLLPESSSIAPVEKTPVLSKPNPFKNTPPRFAALQASPAKSSPLRQEIRASDSEESSRQGLDGSVLPPSSPFHTYVDDSTLSVGSDEQQFRMEMEGQTDSSIRHLRNEADGYLDAYEPQERTLGEIEEVTEPSRPHQSTMLPSSPPQAIEDSILAPKRAYAPLFGDTETKSSSSTTRSSSSNTRSSSSREKRHTRKPIAKPTIAITPPIEEPAQAGLFTRLTSTIWSALGSAAPPPPHPVTAKFDPLPKVEPWTKTHYKTLDGLYQLHKKQPTLFAPSSTSSTSNTNNTLLTWFTSTTEKKGCKFVGARFGSWGYSVTLTESLVVLCAVYMQLLTLKDIAQYEKVSGKQIQMGDCNPKATGTVIDGNEVVRRLASVVMGEDLRRDERKGIEVKREGAMTVVWPK